MSGGELIKVDDDDICLVEFSLTNFNSETSAKTEGTLLRKEQLAEHLSGVKFALFSFSFN